MHNGVSWLLVRWGRWLNAYGLSIGLFLKWRNILWWSKKSCGAAADLKDQVKFTDYPNIFSLQMFLSMNYDFRNRLTGLFPVSWFCLCTLQPWESAESSHELWFCWSGSALRPSADSRWLACGLQVCFLAGVCWWRYGVSWFVYVSRHHTYSNPHLSWLFRTS